MVVFDLLLIAALCVLLQLRGLAVERAVLYAWRPLVVVEVAGSGHYEPLALLPLVLGAFERQAGFWSNEPWLVRLVGPTLLAAVLLTLLLARSGRAPGGDAAS